MANESVQIEIRLPRATAAALGRIAKMAGLSLSTVLKVAAATELLRAQTPREPTKADPVAPLTDEQIDLMCSPGRAQRWRGDGRQYDRDTARLIESHLTSNV